MEINDFMCANQEQKCKEQCFTCTEDEKCDKENLSSNVFSSISEAVKKLGLDKRVKWKNYLGYLCRYNKKDICPTFVQYNGFPVQISSDKSEVELVSDIYKLINISENEPPEVIKERLRLARKELNKLSFKLTAK